MIIPCFWTCTTVFLEVLWNTENNTEYDYHQYILVYHVSTICYSRLTSVMSQYFCKEPSWLPIVSPFLYSLLNLLFNRSAE